MSFVIEKVIYTADQAPIPFLPSSSHKKRKWVYKWGNLLTAAVSVEIHLASPRSKQKQRPREFAATQLAAAVPIRLPQMTLINVKSVLQQIHKEVRARWKCALSACAQQGHSDAGTFPKQKNNPTKQKNPRTRTTTSTASSRHASNQPLTSCMHTTAYLRTYTYGQLSSHAHDRSPSSWARKFSLQPTLNR